jgi:hypothetical protein
VAFDLRARKDLIVPRSFFNTTSVHFKPKIQNATITKKLNSTKDNEGNILKHRLLQKISNNIFFNESYEMMLFF